MPDRSPSASIIVERTRTGIAPASPWDAEQLDEHKLGTQWGLKRLTKRSNPQNRLYHKMLDHAVKTTSLGDRYPTGKHLHKAMLRELGYVRVTTELGTGKPYIVEDSTAFDNMDDREFGEYFNRAQARLTEITGVDALTFAEAA